MNKQDLPDNWQDFIARQTQSAHAALTAVEIDNAATGFLALDCEQSILQACGEDAANFLHTQLSNDVLHLPSNAARLAAYCTPKGRMLASFLFWKQGDDILLSTHHSIAAPILKRLQMFVLRAKVKLSLSESKIVQIGGKAAAAALQTAGFALPQAMWDLATQDHGVLIRLPDAFGAPRYAWTIAGEQGWPKLAALLTTLAPAHPQLCQFADIQSGIPIINATTQEKFVPQMLNFELIGGVNFKKGCYPGQEIVARSHYLGKLKRRMFLAVSNHAPQAGTEIFDGVDADPCGMIVNAVAIAGQASHFLLELKLASQERSLQFADGTAIDLLSLPYSIET